VFGKLAKSTAAGVANWNIQSVILGHHATSGYTTGSTAKLEFNALRSTGTA